MDTFENNENFWEEHLQPWESPENITEPQPPEAVSESAAEEPESISEAAPEASETVSEAPAAAPEAVSEPAPQQTVYGQPNPYNPYMPRTPYPNYQQPPAYVQQAGGYQPGGQKTSPFADSPYARGFRSAPEPLRYEPQTQPRPKEKKEGEKKGGIGRKIVAAVLVAAIACGVSAVTAGSVNADWEKRTEQMEQEFQKKLDSMQAQIDAAAQAGSNQNSGESVSGTPAAVTEGLTPGQVYARNKDSVVLIYCETVSDYYGRPSTSASTGSGFILTENGYVVSNYHVVGGADKIVVTTADGTQYSAQYVGGDENNDVAMVKIDDAEITKPLQAVTLGSSNDLIVGDQVAAIGNPLGELTSTLTVGYISAKERDVTTDNVVINMLQTDAAINSGNSGGPLFNMKGEVIGITSAKYSGTSSSGATIEGIGFAIPIDDVEGMLMDLMEFGYVTGGYLGVMVSNMDPAEADHFGLPMGAYISEVMSGSCAEAAGIQAKDIITNVGGYEVEGLTDLTRALRNFKGGDTVQVTVYRGGREVVLDVILDEKPQPQAQEQQPQLPSEGPDMPQDGSYQDWFDYFSPFFGG